MKIIKLFRRCHKCGKRLIWKKDRRFGGFKGLNRKGHEIKHQFCAKCGKKVMVEQAAAMRKVGFNV